MGRRNADDRAAVALLGTDLGLGDLRQVVRIRREPLYALAGLGLAVLGVTGGLGPVIASRGAAKAVSAAVFGGLLVLGSLLIVVGIVRAPVKRGLFWYAGGLAEFADDEPEPRVVRWQDVETVTLTYAASGESVMWLDGCFLQARDGTVFTTLGEYRRWVLRAVAREAERMLAPRLVPPLIAAYESGEPVTMGDTRVDQSGVTIDAATGSRIAWTDIRSVTIRHAFRAADYAAPVRAIEIRPRSGDVCSVSVSGVPNGIFLAHLVAHAAARNDVPVLRSPKNLKDPAITAPAQDREHF